MTSIFLSHNSNDKHFVRDLATHLKKEGIKVWVDEAEINVGDSLIKKISDGINNMEYLGAILSPNSINSNWVKKEIEIAMNMEINGSKIKVLPILYRECEIPPFLIGKKYADFTDSANFLRELNNLINAIKGNPPQGTERKIEKKKVDDMDHFDKIKSVFKFASSSDGLSMYNKDEALKFSEEWANKYSISKIKKTIVCFKFATLSDGLSMYNKDEALNFAIDLSNKYSVKEITKLIEIFNFATSSDGLSMYNKDEAWNYAINTLK